jgi:hypothetical protein
MLIQIYLKQSPRESKVSSQIKGTIKKVTARYGISKTIRRIQSFNLASNKVIFSP